MSVAQSPNPTAVSRVEVRAGIEVPYSSFDLSEAYIDAVGHTPDVEPGDLMEVQLGVERSGAEPKVLTVLTGVVESVDVTHTGYTIKLVSPLKALRQMRMDLVFNATTHDKVMDKLLELAGKETWSQGIPSTSVGRSRYVISHEQSLYDVIVELAKEAGFLLFTDPLGRLAAEAWDPSTLGELPEGGLESPDAAPVKHEFVVGRDILDLHVMREIPRVGQLRCTQRSDYGSDSENQLLPVPDEVEVSEEGPKEVYRSITLPWTDRQTSERILNTHLSRMRPPELFVQLVAVGRADVRVGDGVVIRGHIFGSEGVGPLKLPESQHDAVFSYEEEGGSGKGSAGVSAPERTFCVVGLRHIFDHEHGFITEMELAIMR